MYPSTGVGRFWGTKNKWKNVIEVYYKIFFGVLERNPGVLKSYHGCYIVIITYKKFITVYHRYHGVLKVIIVYHRYHGVLKVIIVYHSSSPLLGEYISVYNYNIFFKLMAKNLATYLRKNYSNYRLANIIHIYKI